MAKNFLVGRYYFDTLFREQANQTFIEDLLKEPTFIENNNGYALAHINEEKIDGSDDVIVRGIFAKFKVKEYYKKYRKDKNDFDQTPAENIVDGEIEFFIYHPLHLIFVERSSLISESTFKNKFIKIYERNCSHPNPNMKLDYLVEEKEVYDTIKQWDRVVYAKFNDLRPSNPRMDPHFEDIDKLLKETNGDKSKLEFKVEENPKAPNDKSLDYESKLIKQSLALCSHGYGNAEIAGYKENVRQSIKTEKFIKSITLDFENGEATRAVIDFIKKDQDKEI